MCTNNVSNKAIMTFDYALIIVRFLFFWSRVQSTIFNLLALAFLKRDRLSFSILIFLFLRKLARLWALSKIAMYIVHLVDVSHSSQKKIKKSHGSSCAAF